MTDQTDQPKAKAAARGKVLYKGTADVRRISKEDWASVGIEHEDVEWNAANLYMVPLDQLKLTEDQFAQFIAADDSFVVVPA